MLPFSFETLVLLDPEAELVIEFGAQARFIYANTAAGKDVVDRDPYARYPGEAFAKAAADLRASGAPQRLIIEVQLSETNAAWRELRMVQLPGDGRGHIYAVVYERDAAEQKLLESQLSALARVDPRTGLLRREPFLSEFEREWRRSRRYDNLLSLILVDIDHFSDLNDKYGEAIGDMVLQVVARECQFSLREQDLVGRLGDDEFAILLPETDLEGAALAAQRICDTIASLQLSSARWTVTASVSAGVSQYYGKDETSDAMYLRANAALDHAKQEGGGRVLK